MFPNIGQKASNLFNNNTNNNQPFSMFNNQNNNNNNTNNALGGNNIFNRNNNNNNTNNIFNNQSNNNSIINQPNNNNTGTLFKPNNGGIGQPINTNLNLYNKGPTQNTPNGGGIFNPNNQQPMNTMMGNPQNNNLFTNTLGNNQGGMNGGLFNQNNNQQNNGLFTNSNQSQQNTIFNPQQQNNQGNNFLNQNNMMMNNNIMGNNLHQMVINPQTLMQYRPQQQQQILRSYTPEYIKQLIQNCIANLNSNEKNFQYLTLKSQNILKGQKVSKIGNEFNIKPQLIEVKSEFNSKVKQPIKKLIQKKNSIQQKTNKFAFNIYEKLQVYKARLIQSVSISKMLNEIKAQIDQIDIQIKQFLGPLFNANQTRGYHNFIDPDSFCVKISEKILKNMNNLDNRMDELLVCQGQINNQQIDTGEVIQQLVQYYQNVAITLKQFTDKYNKIKKLTLVKGKYGNADEILRRIHQKANMNVNKQMQPYELLKEIEGILQKREKKGMQYKL